MKLIACLEVIGEKFPHTQYEIFEFDNVYIAKPKNMCNDDGEIDPPVIRMSFDINVWKMEVIFNPMPIPENIIRSLTDVIIEYQRTA